MIQKQLEFKKLHPEARLPARAYATDAGLDLATVEAVTLPAGGSAMIPTGVALAIPEGFFGLIADRSSLGRKGLKVAGGIVDSAYRGEVKVILWNWSPEPVQFQVGDRIAQLLVLPVDLSQPNWVQELSNSDRNERGFGSSGLSTSS